MPIEPSIIDPPLSGHGFSPLRRRSCLMLAVIVVGLLFYLGGKPIAAGLFPVPLDKLAHLVAFASITTLFWIGTNGQMPVAIVVLVAGIGSLDEWHQLGLPGRSADIADFLTDVLAATLAVIVLHALRDRKRRIKADP